MDIEALKDVVRRAEEARREERKVIAAFREAVVGEQGLLPDDEFWAEMGRFQEIAKAFRDGQGRTDWPEQSAGEFFRAALRGAGAEPGHGQSLAILAKLSRFADTYGAHAHRARRALARLGRRGPLRLELGYGSIADFCDSFPLLGREAYAALVREGRLPECLDLGENYLAASLDAAATEWVRILALGPQEDDGAEGQGLRSPAPRGAEG